MSSHATPILTLDQRVDLIRALWARAQGEPVDRVGLTLSRTCDGRWIAIVDAPEHDRAGDGASVDAALSCLLSRLAAFAAADAAASEAA